jgi:regulator of protease activity HflC (stomatin/prohibitin superfamily)
MITLAIVLLVLGVAAVVFSARRRRAVRAGARSEAPTSGLPSASTAAGIGGVVLVVLGVAAAVGTCITMVPTKEFGVVTAFGRPVRTLSNGLHAKLPWEKVVTIDAAIQTDNHTSDAHSCINVRIAHQATACVDTSIRWRIKDSATDGLYQDYRDFHNIRDSLVTRDLNAALNAAFEDYDPLSVDDNGNATTPPLADLSAEVTTAMQRQIGSQIDVLSVIIPVVNFDNNTQGKVNALLAQVAQTRIAQQGIKTSQAQAQANKVLAGSVSKDPNVLVSKCLDLVESGKAALPAGFSCWPASASAVVVPSK